MAVFHKNMIGDNVHVPHTWTYANAAERNAATGFTSEDLYKFAIQTDTGSLWILLSTTPTWGSVTGGDANVQAAVFTMPLRGVTDTFLNFVGENRVISSGETGDYATDVAISGQHAYILVNSITTGGDIVVTGASFDEDTGAIDAGATETITVDTSTSQYYQTSKKFIEVTNIDVSSGSITGINYDIGAIGYSDFNNTDFEILGYRLDAFAQGSNPDFAVVIQKVQDDGNNKYQIVDMENLGFDSGAGGDQIIDNIRTGGFDRTYNPSVGQFWGNDTTLTWKQYDFDSYFSADENILEASTKDEGIILRLEGAPSGGISNVDYITLTIRYRLI